MKELAPGLHQLGGFPPNAFNVYLMEDVVVDAATRHAGRRILRQLEGHPIAGHALTHAHFDHQGASRTICTRFGVPFMVGVKDADAAEDPDLILQRQPDALINRINHRLLPGPGHPVDRQLREGDEVAGFAVLDVPGHSAGHVAFWRESDRVLILGDVLNNLNLATAITGLHEPPTFFTPDPARNRESARRVAELDPSLVVFGHGPPLRDTAKFVDFIAKLPG